MSIKISLDPALEITPTDFVDVWNENEQNRNIAQAKVQTGNQKGFDPALGEQIGTVLLTLAGALATNALYDLLKAQVLAMRAERNLPATRNVLNITEVPQPDGSKLIVVLYDNG